METWIQFGRGPLFRLAFALMLLGLLRSVVLTIVGVVEAYRRNPDKIVNWRAVRRQTFGWLVPINRFWHERPAYSTVSILFHAGLLLVTPFLTGFICSNLAIRPKAYETMMLVHVYSANLIMLLIPFTKIAHCVLAPFSQLVTAVAWKFPAGAGDLVAATLGYADRPNWLKGARLGAGAPSVTVPAGAKSAPAGVPEEVKK